MKKITLKAAVIAIAMLFIAAIPAMAADYAELDFSTSDYQKLTNAEVKSKGDVNQNGSVGADDLLLLKKKLVLTDVSEFTFDDTEAADIDSTSGISTRDLLYLRQGINGIRSLVSKSSATVTTNQVNNTAEIGANSKNRVVVTLDTADVDVATASSIGFSYKATAGGTANVYVNGGLVHTFTAVADSAYHQVILNRTFANNCVITVDFPANSQSDKVNIEAFGIANTQEKIEELATAREVAANGNGGAGITQADYSHQAIVLDSSVMSSLIFQHNIATTYDSTNDAVKLTPNDSSNLGDPYVYLDGTKVASYGINCAKYKYVVYIYKLPKGVTGAAQNPLGQILMQTTAGTEITDCVASYDLARTDVFGYAIANFSSNSKWGGTLSQMRFDYLSQATSINDVGYIDSVVFCANEEAANYFGAVYSAAANAKTTASTELPSTAAEIKAALLSTGSRDVWSSEYIEDGRVCMTAGTKDGFTLARFNDRIEEFVKKTTGLNVEVTVLSGFEELKSQYDVDYSGETDVTLKLSNGTSCWVFSVPCGVYVKEVIFDNDLGSDCDDSAAVAVLVEAHKKGYCKILAITNCVDRSGESNAGAWNCSIIEAIIRYYNENGNSILRNGDEINITDSSDENYVGIGATNRNSQTNFEGWAKSSQSGLEASCYGYVSKYATEAYSAENVIRSALNRSHGNVTVVTSGMFSTIYSFVNGSAADKALFENKVGHYVFGGGNFPNGSDENNLFVDQEASNAMLNNLIDDTKYQFTFVGAEVAGIARTGALLQGHDSNCVAKGVYQYVDSGFVHPSWDQGFVYYAVYGTSNGYFSTIDGIDATSYGHGQLNITYSGNKNYVIRTTSVTKLKDVLEKAYNPSAD